ncbi:MAG: hypothetical protein RL748_1613 [Pseudomonadota bacterium]|jgi:ribonuclease I
MKFLKQITAFCVALACAQAQAGKLEAHKWGDFSTYSLALSWQAGFCKKMSEGGKLPAECNNPPPANKADYLTIHGLWPSLPASLEAKMQGKDAADKMKTWFRYGCSARPLTFPSFGPDKKCAAPAMNFSPAFRAELVKAMPGATDTTCLDRYEYAKHGVCFEFNQEDYFGTMLRFDTQVKGGKFGRFLADNYGKSVSREALTEAFAADFGQESLQGLSLSCSQGVKGSALAELQLVIKSDMVNEPLSAKSFGSNEGRSGNCVGSILIGNWGG